jgi:acetyl esterase/lipase
MTRPMNAPIRLLRFALLGCAAALAACAGSPAMNALNGLREVEQATNVIYDEVTGLKLDLYRPVDARGETVVVFFHGARWSHGDKRRFEFLGRALAAHGVIAVLPDVRQYPDVKFPAFVEDGASALKWTRENVGKYGGSIERLFVMGQSSGAHIAALLALDEQYLKRVGGGPDWLRGMIGIAGPYDFLPITAPDLRDMFGPPEEFEKSQPIFYAEGRNPPVLLLHSEDDREVSVRNTRNLARALRNAESPVETVIYLDQGHEGIATSLSLRQQGRTDAMSSILDFMRRTLDGKPAAAIACKAFVEPEALPEGQALPPQTQPLAGESEPAPAEPAPTPTPAPAPEPKPEPKPEQAPPPYRPDLLMDDSRLRPYGVEHPQP